MRFQTKEETRRWAASFAAQLRAGDVVSLEGDLGAGKTQIVQWIAQALGATSDATSPTFALVRQYPTRTVLLTHMDLYRLEYPEELEEMDIDAYFYPDGITFIEWAKRAGDYLPGGLLHVEIQNGGGEQREVNVWRD